MEKTNKDQVPERKGKSWKREREERGRRQQQKENSKCEEDKVVETKELSAVETESCDFRVSKEELIVTEEEVLNVNSETAEDVEERIRQEEIARKEDDKKYLFDYIAETQERLSYKANLRLHNREVYRNLPEEYYFTKLDSNLKKNTAFVRKLKTFTEGQKDSMLKDMGGLNLTKYISEVAAAIVEAKLKMSDIPSVLHLCSELHRIYAEFPSQLLDKWHKALNLKKEEKTTNASKLRVDLRFYAELISIGVFLPKEGLPLLGTTLTLLVNMDKEEHNNMAILLSFCKHCGEDYAGLIPRKVRVLSEEYNVEVPKSDLLNSERQRNVRQLLKEYYASLCKHLVKEYKDLQVYDRQNHRLIRLKGELSLERKDKAEAFQISFQKLLSNTQQLAEVLDEDVPDFPEDELNKQEEIKLEDGEGDGDTNLSALIWEDEDARCFYESLPDLKAFLPSILYRDSLQPTTVPETKEEEQIDEDIDFEELEKENKLEEADADGRKEEEILPPDIEELEEPESNISASNKIILDAFLNHLPNCINREIIDNAAMEFVMNLNTKHNRKKLVRALYLVPRTRLDLLPFYARLVAILHPCMPDVATELAHLLKQDFKYQTRKKDQINIESKIKIVRFIGEMVKFKMFAKTEALFCLKLLLFDFRHHHIEMACNLLETCGRYVFHSPDSHHRTKIFLEVIMRKKSATVLDSRYVTMIENAYYYVNPPEVSAFTIPKERPPLHEYVRKLLYQDLAKTSTERVLRQMRKLNWDDPDLSAYAIKCLTNAWNVKFYNIRCLASLIAGLVQYQDFVGPQVVDGVLEDVRLGMEVNNPKYSQRRVTMVKYLGELYNYRIVESAVIFQILYSFIAFGVSLDPNLVSELDPIDNLFRIRLTCVLLETCGQYFNSGTSKKKLDYYFIFFQHYYWFKYTQPTIWTEETPFPVFMEYLVKDNLQALRPKLLLYKNFEEAQKAVSDLEEEYRAKIMEIIPSAKENLGFGTDDICEEDVDGLGTISEVAEEEGDEESVGDWTENTTESLSPSQLSQQLPPLDEEQHSSTQGETMDIKDEFTHHPKPKHIDSVEDDDFMAAFDKMVSENIQDRLRESVRAQQVDISVPFHVRTSLKKTYEQLQEPEPSGDSNVNFVLMVRKGNKQQYKNLTVPIQSELAQNLKNREEAERAEKERVKRLTLDINERLEEEDYQEMQAQVQRPIVMNLNRERRQKYQHPKGAPDADMIFGAKKDE